MKSKMLLILAGALAALAVACGSSEAAPPSTATAVKTAKPAPAATLAPSSQAFPAATPAPSPRAATAATPTPAAASSAAGPQTLAAGMLALPAALAFGQPGFHEVLTVAGNLPANLADTSGLNLVLALSDAGRPRQTCNAQHPLSGCATVDWSDGPGRPNVPSDGIFVNSLQVELASESHIFFLTDSGNLGDSKNRFQPG